MSQERADFSRRALLWLYPEGTRLQDLLLPLVTAVMTLVAAGIGWSLVHSQKQDAALINIAGRQRLLLVRHLRETEHDSGGALDRFTATARAVRDGGLVDGLPAGEGNRIQPYTDPFIRQKMDEQLRLADELRKAVTDPVRTRALVEEGLKGADEAVRQFVSRSQEKTRELLWIILGTTGLLSLLGLFLARLIVERRIRLEQLLVARDAALKASNAKTHFLANMSHEIRTPLNAIIGMTEILESTPLSGEQGRFVKTLRRAGDTLLSLINDILDLSKIESGQVELHRREVPFAELCDRIVEIVALRAHQKGLELTSYIAPGIPPMLLVDETRVRQVLINLLGNAVKFTSAGEVALRAELEKREGDEILLRISVSDTGIGIPESKFAAIFEDFSQVDPSIAVNYGGTGLGLAISKRLVALMGGKIWVRSQPGAGSTFTFTLPAREVERAKATAPAPNSSLAGRRALVVDDNATNRLIVRRYLEEQSIRVEEVESGAEALEVLERASKQHRPFDVIFLDFRMPGLSGVDVAERLSDRGLGDGAIVLLLTSDGRRNDLGNLQEIGINDFMVKPVRRTELLEATARALSGKSRPETPEEAESSAKGFPGKRVLVVDDVEDNRFIALTYLAALGCEVETASSGEESIEKAREGRFDLVFMDMRMAPMDGYEATRRIRAAEGARGSRRCPLIALTAHAMKEEIERALEAGCDLHVTKPLTREKLMAAMQRFFKPVLQPAPNPVAPALARTPSASAPAATGAIRLDLDDFLKPRLTGYLASVRSRVESIAEALEKGDFPEIAKSGHNISGTAGIYGMGALGQLAHELEVAALRSDRDAVARLNRQIENYLARVVF